MCAFLCVCVCLHMLFNVLTNNKDLKDLLVWTRELLPLSPVDVIDIRRRLSSSVRVFLSVCVCVCVASDSLSLIRDSGRLRPPPPPSPPYMQEVRSKAADPTYRRMCSNHRPLLAIHTARRQRRPEHVSKQSNICSVEIYSDIFIDEFSVRWTHKTPDSFVVGAREGLGWISINIIFFLLVSSIEAVK